MICIRCGETNREGARFCDRCGARLVSAADGGDTYRSAPSPSPSPALADGGEAAPDSAAIGSASVGEQRHVTVMFCDLVNSTERAQRLELEEWRDLVRSFQGACYREVSRAGGFVAQYLGDGVLAYFGYPAAHGQDARAAVGAASEIVRAFREPPARARGAQLLVRVGIDSGVVLASEMGFGASRQPLVVGNVPNRAARIQAAAAPNTVVISEATHRLVHGSFVCESIGEHPLRGQEQPVPLYRVVRARPQAQGPTEDGGRLTPLVGRTPELDLLLEQWRAAQQGSGQIVFLSGEAGVGKSRLVRELKARAAGSLHFKFEFRGAPHSEGSALLPVLEHLRRAWRLDRVHSLEEAGARLGRALASRGAQPDEMALMASLLEIAWPDVDPSRGDTSQRRKQRTLELLTDLLFDAAARRPTLLIIEDLHWVDPSSLELIRMIATRIRGAAVLMLLSLRPEGAPPWADDDRTTRIALERLGPADTEAMIRQLSGETPLPPELLRDLVEKSDGVPLYVEEVTRLVLDAGFAGAHSDGDSRALHSLADLGVPATLQESLIARLDRLGPSKDLAQLCAVVGRSFDLDLIREASGVDEANLRKQLDRLRELDILQPLDAASSETLVFKHALIQDAAYASLVRSRRRELHRHVGDTLATKFSDRIETRPELLAHHWAEADRADAAIPCLLSAGKRASERSAYVEAARHLKQGLTLLETLPAGETRSARELELCLALGPVLVATRGYSNPEVEKIYARARALCATSGDDRLLYAALSGLHLFHQSRSELATCAELAERRREIARRLDDPALEMHVLETVGTVAFWRGQHEVALAALRGALALYDAPRGHAIRLMYGTDSRVVSAAYEALALWYGGDPAGARTSARAAVDHARALADVHSLALALVFSAIVHLNRGELEEAQLLADEAVARSTEQRLEQWLGSALFVSGLLQVRLGHPDAGFAALAQGSQVYGSVGATVGGRYFVAGLGEAFLLVGKPQEGLAALAMIGAAFPAGEDTCHDADLIRVQGELVLAAKDDVADATAAFQQGLALARSQGARSLELRSAIALARLHLRQQRPDEARALLQPLRPLFESGDPTTDARAASELFALALR
jgi:class 3 adenylate cyclase/tetratricopeptide (TPR) repeat protein